MQGKPVRLIADALLSEPAEVASGRPGDSSLPSRSPGSGAPALGRRPEPSQAARPAGESAGAASDQLPGVAPAG
jgi:hypothetical protein